MSILSLHFCHLKIVASFYSIKEELGRDSLTNVGVLVLGCPRQKFTQNHFAHIRRHIEEGGSLLVMMEEGGEKKAQSNINFLLEEFGIAFNNGI